MAKCLHRQTKPATTQRQPGPQGNAQAIPEPVREQRLREALERIVKLYEAWHEAEPDQGYDQKAAEWRAKLTGWQATTRPATGNSQPASDNE